MKIDGWRYYNHAAIPSTPPHIDVDLTPLQNSDIWKLDGSPKLARYITDYDCGYETSWWYVIKDTPFDLSTLKAKRRYEINKGNKNFDVREIIPPQHIDDIFKIQVASYALYPSKYRPIVDYDKLQQDILNWNFYKVYGAFDNVENSMVGYAILNKKDNYIDFLVLKVIPEFERRGCNAAVVFKILDDHKDFLRDGYICDGARNISHETAFQDYLEKYFEFRKAYCHLHIEYNPKMKIAVKFLYPLRNLLNKMDSIKIIHSINGVLKMETYVREQVKNNE